MAFITVFVAFKDLIVDDLKDCPLDFSFVISRVIDLLVDILLCIGQEVVFLSIFLDQRFGLQPLERLCNSTFQSPYPP